MQSKFINIFLAIFLATVPIPAAAQDNSVVADQLKRLLDRNDQLFQQLQSQGSDTTGVGVMTFQLTQYFQWLKSRETRSIVEENSDVKAMLARIAIFYQATRNVDFEEFHSFFEDYYQSSQQKDYLLYCSVNEQYYMHLCGLKRFYKASTVAIAMNEAIEAAGDTSLINSVVKYYVANAFAMQNFVTQTEQWLDDSYRVGKGKAEDCENEFLVQRYGDMLVTRARLFSIQGKYDDAESMLDEMLSLVRKRYGKQTLFYANGLLLKADLLVVMGRMGDLQKICEEAASIISKLNDIDPVVKQNLQVALQNYQARLGSTLTVDNKASLLPGTNERLVALWRQVDEANQRYDWNKVLEAGTEWCNAVEEMENVNFKEYEMMAQSLTQSYLSLGLFTEASQFLDHAQAFVKQHNVFDHQADRFILFLQGEVYAALGNRQMAMILFNRSKAMYENVGDRSIFYMQCLMVMTEFFMTNSDWAYAKLFIDELNRLIDELAQGLSEENMASIMSLKNSTAAYLLMMGYSQQAIVDLKESLQYYDETHDEVNWRAAFFRLMAGYIKTKDMDALSELLKEIDRHNLPANQKRHLKISYGIMVRDSDAIDELEQYNRETKDEVDRLRGSLGTYEQEAFWESRVRWLNWYNYQLAARMPDYPKVIQQAYNNALYVRRSNLDKPVVKWEDVRAQLGDHDVAIEMISTSELKANGDDKFIYAALVLRKEYDAPKFVMLCETEPVNRIWQNVIHTDTALINAQYSLSNSSLCNLVWKPLTPYLQKGDNIYYVTAGLLSRFNFSAMAENGVRLSDRYQLRQLSTTAEIGHLKNSASGRFHDAAVYGGIAYDASNDEMLLASASYKKNVHESDVLAVRSAYRGAVGQLLPLPGTGEEARVIHQLLTDKKLNSRLYDGIHANEESMKAFSGHSPSIIHIGTHGFLLNTSNDIMSHQSFLDKVVNNRETQVSSLNYSGLMFAGAENAWSGEQVPEGVEDGILTSYELSQLDLSNTNLMVLSACETALGHIDENLGDFGLKRALKQAGVGTVVVSLWEVPDEPTRLLMTSFFKLITDGVDSHKALQKAQEEVRRKYPQPYYWASFVMID